MPDVNEAAERNTVQVRIAVAVDPKGRWNATGWPDDGGAAMDVAVDEVGGGEARYWLTATLPVPEAVEVQAKVEDAQ